MTTEKMIVTVHFAGGNPLVIGSVPAKQADEFYKSMSTTPVQWHGITTVEGLTAALNREQITWIELREDHRKEPDPKNSTGNCYVRHEVAPGVHQDTPHTHEEGKA
jgi:hypothetical protein